MNQNKFEIILPHNHLNDLIGDRLKEIEQLKETIKLKNLIKKQKTESVIILVKFHCPLRFQEI